MDRLAFVLPILALVFFVLAIWLSPRRPRTIMWIGLGTVITFAILAIVRARRASTVMNGIDDPLTRDAADSIWSQCPQRPAHAGPGRGHRAGVASWPWPAGSSAARGRRERPGGLPRHRPLRGDRTAEPPAGSPRFVSRFRRPIQLVAVAIGILVLLIAAKVTFGLVLLAALIVIVVLVLVELIAGPPSAACRPRRPTLRQERTQAPLQARRSTPRLRRTGRRRQAHVDERVRVGRPGRSGSGANADGQGRGQEEQGGGPPRADGDGEGGGPPQPGDARGQLLAGADEAEAQQAKGLPVTLGKAREAPRRTAGRGRPAPTPGCPAAMASQPVDAHGWTTVGRDGGPAWSPVQVAAERP